MTRVLVLFAATPDPAAAFRAAFGAADPATAFSDALGSPADLDIVTWATPSDAVAGARTTLALAERRAPGLDAFFAAIGIRALRDRLARFPAGRLLNSIGPADAARTFWRSYRSARSALDLAGPDVIVIAGDLPATRAARKLLDRGTAARALWGLRAAADQLVRERA